MFLLKHRIWCNKFHQNSGVEYERHISLNFHKNQTFWKKNLDFQILYLNSSLQSIPIKKFQSIDYPNQLLDHSLFWTNICFKSMICILNLNNYFDFHVCLSIRTSFCHSGRYSQRLAPFPAVVWQNVTNKSCLVCVKSEKYTFLVTTRPLESMRWGEGELHTLQH